MSARKSPAGKSPAHKSPGRAPSGSPLADLQCLAPGPIAVLIGPEGGFDPAERERLLSLPYATAISLGPRVMRADTAAVAALALVNAAAGRGW